MRPEGFLKIQVVCPRVSCRGGVLSFRDVTETDPKIHVNPGVVYKEIYYDSGHQVHSWVCSGGEVSACHLCPIRDEIILYFFLCIACAFP